MPAKPGPVSSRFRSPNRAKQDERGDERDQGRGEPRPAGTANGLAVAEHEQPEDDRRYTATGKDEREGQFEPPHRLAGRAQESRHERRPRGEVHDPEHEERDRVQPDGLLLGCHWAFLADSRERSAEFPAHAAQSCGFKRWAERPIVAGEPES